MGEYDRRRARLKSGHIPGRQMDAVGGGEGEIAVVQIGIGWSPPLGPLGRSASAGRVVAEMQAVEGAVDRVPDGGIGLAKDVAGKDGDGGSYQDHGTEQDKDSI